VLSTVDGVHGSMCLANDDGEWPIDACTRFWSRRIGYVDFREKISVSEDG
jgi:hypothetical protein